MSDCEQTALDTRLEPERTIAENIMTTIKFVEVMTVDGDNPPSKVRNRHEAYGIAAERFSAVNGAIKNIKGDMAQLLRTLADPNYPALKAVSSLCNSSAAAAKVIIEMAAEMQRTLSDLYTYETVEKPPWKNWPNRLKMTSRKLTPPMRMNTNGGMRSWQLRKRTHWPSWRTFTLQSHTRAWTKT